MTIPFVPTPQSSPIINPNVGSTGAPPIPYLSNTEYEFAPTGVSVSDLNPGGIPAAQAQALADTLRRASRWVDSICFGADAATKGASLAASLTVDSATIRIKKGELRLVCDYRPLIQLIGVSTGMSPQNIADLDSSLFGLARPGRRTFTIPYGGPMLVSRSGDNPAVLPGGFNAQSVYAVWSYVNGYPHTKLASSVIVGATTVEVASTDGNGGLWGVFAASGAFPGTGLTVTDGMLTETVYVQSIATNTPSTGLTTLTTTPFVNAHTFPAPPDFIPVTSMPENVNQAAISLTTMLVKTRGVKGLIMPQIAGQRPAQMTKALGLAGALDDYMLAEHLLDDAGLIVRTKHPGSY